MLNPLNHLSSAQHTCSSFPPRPFPSPQVRSPPNLRRTSCPEVSPPTNYRCHYSFSRTISPHRCRHLGPGSARSRSAQPARSIPTLLIRLGSIRARSPSGSGSSLSDQAEPQGFHSLHPGPLHTTSPDQASDSFSPSGRGSGWLGPPPRARRRLGESCPKEGPYVDNCLMAMGDGLTGGYWLEGTVVTACGDEPNGPDAQSQKEPSCSAIIDSPKVWNCVAGSTQAGLATRRGPITRPGQHSPVMRTP